MHSPDACMHAPNFYLILSKKVNILAFTDNNSAINKTNRVVQLCCRLLQTIIPE